MSLLSCFRLLLSKLTRRAQSYLPHHPPINSPSSSSSSMATTSTALGHNKVDEYGIKHSTLKINGINMHIAEKGDEDRPIVLFVHGFPELWYSWRHQILSLANLGYRAIAPDMRGCGGTDAPTEASAYTYCHTAGDLVALMDALGTERVFVVAHDWGAMVAWHLCLFRPDRVKALVALSVPFPPRTPSGAPVERLRAAYGDDYYVCRFQCPGEIEAEMAEVGGVKNILCKIFAYRESAPLYLPKGGLKERKPLPSFLSDEEFSYYLEHYERTGLTGGLNYYRALDLNWEITTPWTGAQVKVPVKFIVGDLDLTFHAPSTKDYVCKGGMKKFVPLLQEVVVMEGVGHFIQQEKPDEISRHIYDFIQNFS